MGMRRGDDVTLPAARGYEPPSLCHIAAAALPALLGIGDAAAASAGIAGGAAAGAGAAAAATGAAGASLWPTLSTIGAVSSLAGAGLQAVGQINNARYQSQLAKVENEEEQQKANQDAAAGERQQIQQNRQTELAVSRATALAAAGGGAVSDPSVVNLEGNIAQQGATNALTAQYNGLSRASQDQYQGQIDLFQGKQAEAAAPLAAAGTVLSGLSSFFNNRAMLSYYRQTGGAPYPVMS